MSAPALIPHLFRTEYSKITAVLCKLFGIEHMETAEDIASDTFLMAMEQWSIKGLPPNPTAWLYTVAKNKAINYLKRDRLLQQKIAPQIKYSSPDNEDPGIDLSPQHIEDSQLQMMFAICDPVISQESQIGLALRILCGFGIEEIADAFLTNKETINKRLTRAREKLRSKGVSIALPAPSAIEQRLQPVLTTLYLLFNEGYYSQSRQVQLRKDLCLEAMRLTLLLRNNKLTNKPEVNALLALMCFHASRFEARTDEQGVMILYQDQDETLWNQELISKGKFYLVESVSENPLGKYHIEAAIAYWHTHKADTPEKWEQVLQLYNKLLQLEYSPVAALNRTYALSKARDKEEAVREALKLDLKDYHLYHSLMGELYTDMDTDRAVYHLQLALALTKSANEQALLKVKLEQLQNS